MKILRIKTDGTREYAEISGDLRPMQKEVGGLIEVLPIDENMDIVIDEEGLLKNKKVSLIIADGFTESVMNAIVGDCFICGESEEDLVGLTDEQVRWLDMEMLTDGYVWDDGENDVFRKVTQIWV